MRSPGAKGYVEAVVNLLGRFTTGGQKVKFGTGRTLVLLNGRRIADYPLPFGGEQAASTSARSDVALARVELLSSGASASTAPTRSAAC
jgi:hypothetical protein